MVCSPRMKRLISAAFAVMLVCGSGVDGTNSAWARNRHQNAQVNALGILGVRLNQDGSGLSLDANRAFTADETRNFSVLKLPSPYRLVLDIPNARLLSGQKVFPINQQGVERVELVDTQSPFYSSVRAIVYVQDNQTLTRLSPEFDGKTLKLLGGMPIAMTPEQVASTNFVRRTNVQHTQPLPPVARPSAAMSKSAPTPPAAPAVAQRKQEDSPAVPKSVQTVLDGPVAPGTAIVDDIYFRDNKLFIKSASGSELSITNRFNLTAPNRLVLEIGGAVLKSRDLLNPITTNSDDMRQIRVGQFDEKTVRIVIEGNDPEQCEAIYHGGEKNLLAISPYSSTSITKLSANTQLGEVQSIDLKREGNNTILRLTASTPIVHRFLKKDDKIVLDLLNEAAHPTNIGFDAKQYPEIAKMRLEPLTDGQPNSKLAIMLASPGAKVVPSISEDGKVLELQISMDEAALAGVFPNLAGLSKAPFPARIVVDAGHGGKDNGAMRSGVNEKDLNLSLALMVRDALQARGFKVYMTRSTDVFLPLPQITAITNQIHPDLFISIHHNASVNPAAKGIETYYYTPQSVALAGKVQAREINSVGAQDGGVKKAMFYVIHHTSVPAILCEVGYVSNPSELAELQTFERKSKTARAIADGVVDYLKTRVSAKAK